LEIKQSYTTVHGQPIIKRDICFELTLRPVQLEFLVTVIILGIKWRSLVLFNESLAIPEVTNHCR